MSENMDRNRSAEEPVEVTAVQFPKIEPEDIPSVQFPKVEPEDVPMGGEVLEDIPLLEEDRPIDKGWLYNWVYKMDDQQFKRAQTIFGLIIGLAAVVALFFPTISGRAGDPNDRSSTWSMVAMLALAMLLPRFIERKIEKRIPRAQTAMIIALGAGLVGFGIYMFLTGGFTRAA